MTPIVSRSRLSTRRHFTRRSGAIAQLGERVVRNDEVGGSIPPGSTTLRPSGFAWRSRVIAEGRSVVPGEALLGVDGLQLHQKLYFPVHGGGRCSITPATPSRKSLPRSDIAISRSASMVASASVWNGTS